MQTVKPTKRPSVKEKNAKKKLQPGASSVADAAVAGVPAASTSPASTGASAYDRSQYGSAKSKKPKADDEAPDTKESSLRKSVKASGKSRKLVKDARRKRVSKKFLIVSGIIALLLVVAIGVLSWNQWLRYDDAADIQGTWVADGTEQVITITDTTIQWTDTVSYDYTLDTFGKSITFSFKQYSGQGSYAFSEDRNAVSITETDADTGEDVTTTLVRQQ